MSSNKEKRALCPSLPPLDRDHQVVRQLDYINRDSEEKMMQIFDMLEEVHSRILRISESAVRLESQLQAKRLNRKRLSAEVVELEAQSCGASSEIMAIMDMLQYQDFHRQKIERVVSQMREVAHYIETLFASDIEDGRRSSRAHYIAGDEEKRDLLSEEELSALIDNFTQMRS